MKVPAIYSEDTGLELWGLVKRKIWGQRRCNALQYDTF